MSEVNVGGARASARAARAAGVRRFVLVSFPHVEGPTTPEAPATDRQDLRCADAFR